jgi:hypothetical protein
MQASDLLQSYLVDADTWDEMHPNASVREQHKKAVEFMQKLMPQVVTVKLNEDGTINNLYRKYMKMVQQQQ